MIHLAGNAPIFPLLETVAICGESRKFWNDTPLPPIFEVLNPFVFVGPHVGSKLVAPLVVGVVAVFCVLALVFLTLTLYSDPGVIAPSSAADPDVLVWPSHLCSRGSMSDQIHCVFVAVCVAVCVCVCVCVCGCVCVCVLSVQEAESAIDTTKLSLSKDGHGQWQRAVLDSDGLIVVERSHERVWEWLDAIILLRLCEHFSQCTCVCVHVCVNSDIARLAMCGALHLHRIVNAVDFAWSGKLRAAHTHTDRQTDRQTVYEWNRRWTWLNTPNQTHTYTFIQTGSTTTAAYLVRASLRSDTNRFCVLIPQQMPLTLWAKPTSHQNNHRWFIGLLLTAGFGSLFGFVVAIWVFIGLQPQHSRSWHTPSHWALYALPVMLVATFYVGCVRVYLCVCICVCVCVRVYLCVCAFVLVRVWMPLTDICGFWNCFTSVCLGCFGVSHCVMTSCNTTTKETLRVGWRPHFRGWRRAMKEMWCGPCSSKYLIPAVASTLGQPRIQSTQRHSAPLLEKDAAHSKVQHSTSWNLFWFCRCRLEMVDRNNVCVGPCFCFCFVKKMREVVSGTNGHVNDL